MSAAGLGMNWGAGSGGSGALVWAKATVPIRTLPASSAIRFIGSRFLLVAYPDVGPKQSRVMSSA